jgi:signal transduction histidine kinase
MAGKRRSGQRHQAIPGRRHRLGADGIPPADRERVFAPFQRLEQSRNRDTGGVGLGLSVARSIVRSHGGDITLDDAPGGGLLARVTLPAG